VLERKTSLLGTPVVTTRGERIGQIGDMYFEETSGTIVGYEVSGGALGDAMRGTSWLPLSAIQVIGPDAVIAEPVAADIVESQVGGVQGALDATRDRVGDALASATEPDPGTEDGAAVAPPDPVAEDPDGALVGRRATTDVMDANGSVVLANGQTVTLEHVQRARAEGGLDALYRAVGMERPVPVSEQLQGAVQSASESASDLWSRFTSRLTEMTDSAGKRIDAQQTRSQLERIHDAIGRPVTKVFLDREDNVILDLGDLVTHQAIQRAHDAGQLEVLLASVYKGEVSFTQDEMKAPVPGDSTIEQATGGAILVDELEAHAEAVEAEATQGGSGDADEEQTEPAEGAAERKRRTSKATD
jgi:sporulation protein YlmC with PRC-barrel domain